MQSSRVIHVVSCHAEGEVGDVIVGGVAPPPGASLWEQSRFIAEDDRLRRFVLNEPRGGVFRHVNLLVPPVDPRAQMGWIIMEPEDTPPMSGSNSICVATVLLETGIVPLEEPETRLVLEAPGGVVEIAAECRAGRVARVRVRNVPSFADRLDAALEVEGLGTITVDTAYGGDSFVLVDAARVGAELEPRNARELALLGSRITRAANEQLGFTHPENPGWDHISFCQFTDPLRREGDAVVGRNTVSIRPAKLDRSPTGTGCSARMAVLHARGELRAGEAFIGESIIGSRFDCRIEAETTVAGRPAIVPSIAGRAWITGTHQHTLDPEDPWPEGYRLSDTWPNANPVSRSTRATVALDHGTASNSAVGRHETKARNVNADGAVRTTRASNDAVPYVGVDLTDRHAAARRPADVCGLLPVRDGKLKAEFWTWLWPDSTAPLQVDEIAAEIQSAECVVLDGPQALATEGQNQRAAERLLGTPGKTPDHLDDTGRPFAGYLRSSVELFAALYHHGVPVSPAGHVGGVSEYYPGDAWSRMVATQLPKKDKKEGRYLRRRVLELFGVDGLPELPSHDENDACLGAVMAAATAGRVPGLAIEAIGQALTVDPDGTLREGPILVPVVDEYLARQISAACEQ